MSHSFPPSLAVPGVCWARLLLIFDSFREHTGTNARYDVCVIDRDGLRPVRGRGDPGR
jgi:hypothetical protein